MRTTKGISGLIFLLIGLSYSQDVCRTPNQRDGVCVPRAMCRSFEEYFSPGRILNEQEANFLYLSVCSEGPRKICCPDRALRNVTSINPVTTTTTTTPSPVTDSVDSTNLLPDPNKFECGLDILVHHIYGGMEASLDEFPWYALLEYVTLKKERLFECGGTLISRRYVLTAAHCLSNQKIDSGVEFVNIRLGEHNTTSEEDCEGEGNDRFCSDPPQNIGFEEIIIHPGYSKTDRNQHHDIALIRLAKDAELNHNVNPICLPDAQFSPTQTGKNITIAGFGHTGQRRHSGVKLKVQMPIVDQTQCRNKWVKYTLNDGQLCAGGLFNIDSCFGDSGGPLMTQRLYWTLEGIVSFGNRCGLEGWPSIYTRVTSYVDWIRSVVRP